MDNRMPKVKLIGRDGNAFAILAACRAAAKKAEWPPKKIEAVMAELRSGNYAELLATACKYFDVR